MYTELFVIHRYRLTEMQEMKSFNETHKKREDSITGSEKDM